MILTPPEWTEEAVCASVDPAIFFPRKGGSTAEAKHICRSCPVVTQCLTWALEYEAGLVPGVESTQKTHGIFGGLSATERAALLKAAA